MAVTLTRAGMQTTVQDLGRPGYRSDGVPLGGAMDRLALRLANLLVGNEETAAALEFVMRGPELLFSEETLIAVAGADFGGVPLWRPVRVAAGTTLKFTAPRQGCRGYLAVAGGFEVTRVLGSASTYLRAGFGGVGGRALQDGDVLPTPTVQRRVAPHWRIDARLIPAYASNPLIRVVPGAQAAEFGRTLWAGPYRVSAQSDRMGFRLKGALLQRSVNVELHSATVVPGTIQVPPDGQPIVLMADAQTIGGYPQIAHVITADLPLVAQLAPGDTLRFSEVSLAEAHQLGLAREHALAMLRHGLAQKLA